MSLKPGWLIAMGMLFIVIQFLIVIGTASLGQASDFNTINKSPVESFLSESYSFIKNPVVATFDGSLGDIMADLKDVLTFKADFLSGAWGNISVFFTCIYGALTIAFIVYLFRG